MISFMRRRVCVLIASLALICQCELRGGAFADEGDDDDDDEEQPGGGANQSSGATSGAGSGPAPPEEEIPGSDETPSTSGNGWAGNTDNPVDDATGGRMGGGSLIESATGDSISAGGMNAWGQGFNNNSSDESVLVDERSSIASSAYGATARGGTLALGDFDISGHFELGAEGEATDKSGGAMLGTEPLRLDSFSGTLFLPVAEAAGVYVSGEVGAEGATLGGVGLYVGAGSGGSFFVGTDLSRPFPNADIGFIAPIGASGLGSASVNIDASRSYQSFIEEGGQVLENWERGLFDYVNFNSTGY